MGLLSTIGAASARAYGFTRSAIAAAVDAYFNLTTLLLPGQFVLISDEYCEV